MSRREERKIQGVTIPMGIEVFIKGVEVKRQWRRQEDDGPGKLRLDASWDFPERGRRPKGKQTLLGTPNHIQSFRVPTLTGPGP
jgi:hypothetical protein